jgi:hypothetical protein
MPSPQELTNPEQLSPLPPQAEPVTDGGESASDAAVAATAMQPALLGIALFGAALVLCLLGYLAAAVPGPWFPAATPLSWGPRDVAVMRGKGVQDRGVLFVSPPDADGTALISINTDFRSSDYRAIVWDVTDLPADADVRMLWRSDYASTKMHSTPVVVAAGRLLPVDASAQPDWIGRIKGIALTVRGGHAQPVSFRGVTAAPMGAREVLGDRLREWLTFEGWNGTSINGLAGGAVVQSLPLPTLLAGAAAIAMAATLPLLRRRLPLLPIAIGAVFVAAWLVGDLRWGWNLARQAMATGRQFAGMDQHDRHGAAEDGALFAFIERIRAKLPPDPARIFVAAEAAYVRDRGAYYLYPHNVLFDPYRDTLPPTAKLRAGDYFLVYQRRGIQYSAAEQQLRFPDGTTVAAELVLLEPGAALFRIR